MRRVVARMIGLLRGGAADADLAREVASHLVLLEDEYRRRGLSSEQARLAARRAIGSVALAKDLHRDARSFAWVDDARRDAWYAIRTLLRNPGFAVAVVVTLALGIGASTAIFSVAYGVSLRPLPYPEPDRLVRIYEANLANGRLKEDVSDGAFHAWREGARSIEAAALYSKSATRFLAGSLDRSATTMSVSPAFFDVLGARPILGPGFKLERDYTRSTANDEAVLSYAAWQRLFGGRPDVIGQRLEFTGAGDNDVYRVVGVMSDGFAFGEAIDLWRPANIIELPVPRLLWNWRYDRMIARLRPGATIAHVRAELESVSARVGREFPVSNTGWSATVESLHESVIGNFGRGTWLLFAAVAVVLFVTCVNVAGLMVARAVAREREMAVRTALGAGSWRLLRLCLTEAVVLSAGGGSLGVLLAWFGLSALKAAAPAGIPRLDAVALDLPSLVVAGISSVLAVATFTTARLRDTERRQLVDRLRGSSAHAGDGCGTRSRRRALIAAQCAGAAILVVLAAMLTRSFVKITSFDLGWEASGVLSLRVSPPIAPELRRPWYRYVEWSDRLIATLEATPGVDRAAITTQVPLAPNPIPSTLAKGRGRAAADDQRWPGVAHHVTDGYFEVMSVRLVRGRTFGRVDRFSELQLLRTEKAEQGVVIVSESTARTLWPGRSALGEALWLPDIDNATWREVVGVVEDIQFHGVGEAPALHVFVPWTQMSTANPRLVVKGTDEGASRVAVVRDVVTAVEPGTRIDQIEPLEALVSRATAQPRFVTRTVAAFSTLALVLAAVGIYGTLSYLVGARTREIGIRLALGAPRGDVLRQTVVSGLTPAIAGGLGGLPAAWVLARSFPTLFFQAPPFDAVSLAAGAGLLMLVALAAALMPAHRAARIEPLVALRSE
jgi:predicted permease